VIPLRDLNPVSTRPVVTYAIIAINVVVWLLEVFVWLGQGDGAMQALIYRYGVVPWYLVHDPHVGSWITPISSMFMHGGWMHVIGNMWFLWIFGDNVEDALGKARFVAFYVLCGLAAVAAQVAIDPSSQIPMVGASGAIAGVLAAYVTLYPRARILTLVPIFIFIQFMELPAFLFIFVWFGFQLLSGYVSLGTVGQEMGGTAFFAHIGGFVAGLALVRIMRKRDGGRSPHRVHYRPRAREPHQHWGVDRNRPWN